MSFSRDGNALVIRRQGETVRIEAWGKDSLRVRSTMQGQFTGNLWALTEKIPETQVSVTIDGRETGDGDGAVDTA